MNAVSHPDFTYSNELTLGEALKRYFVLNNFGADGNYSDRWVEVKLGPVPFTIPNTAARVRAVRYHDLNHIVTEYQTDLAGEMKIAAWELASGCRDFVVAWSLNLSGLAFGLARWPRRTLRAFLRGRRSKNFYGSEYGPELLAQPVGEMRRRLGVPARDTEIKATASDVLALVGYLLAGVPVLLLNSVGSLLLTPVALISNAILKSRRAAGQTT
jgi:hypothetical protein